MFVVGSIGYMYTAISYLNNTDETGSCIINTAAAFLFQLDAFMYLWAIDGGATSRATPFTPSHYVPLETKKRLGGILDTYTSKLDYYYMATWGFIIGSAVYCIAAVYDALQTFYVPPTGLDCTIPEFPSDPDNPAADLDPACTVDYSNELSILYMIGAIIFIVDSILYLMSGLQERNVVEEVPFSRRSMKFMIEKVDPLISPGASQIFFPKGVDSYDSQGANDATQAIARRPAPQVQLSNRANSNAAGTSNVGNPTFFSEETPRTKVLGKV